MIFPPFVLMRQPLSRSLSCVMLSSVSDFFSFESRVRERMHSPLPAPRYALVTHRPRCRDHQSLAWMLTLSTSGSPHGRIFLSPIHASILAGQEVNHASFPTVSFRVKEFPHHGLFGHPPFSKNVTLKPGSPLPPGPLRSLPLHAGP